MKKKYRKARVYYRSATGWPLQLEPQGFVSPPQKRLALNPTRRLKNRPDWEGRGYPKSLQAEPLLKKGGLLENNHRVPLVRQY